MSTKTVNSEQLFVDWLTYQKERHAHPELHGLHSTGLGVLDKIIGGIELGQLVIIGGPQKSGKTTLAARMNLAFLRQDLWTIWFGAEMNNNQMASMVMSSMAGIERKKIRNIQLEERDFTRLESFGKEVKEYHGWWSYGFANIEDINFVLNKIEAQIKPKTIDAIFIDYLQLMEGVGRGRSEEIEGISRKLKGLTLNRPKPMAVVAVSQLNRASIRGEMLDANAFLGSGSIERDMDIGLIIHDIKDESTRHIKTDAKEIVVVGSRETEVDTCRVAYNGALARITDPLPEDQPPFDLNERWT